MNEEQKLEKINPIISKEGDLQVKRSFSVEKRTISILKSDIESLGSNSPKLASASPCV